MYSKDYFAVRFQSEESDALLARYGSGALTEEASAAIIEVLKSRSYDPEKLAAAIVTARKAHWRATKGTTQCDFHSCNNSARWSPVLDGGQRFCSKTCCRNARLMEISEDIPENEIQRRAAQIASGPCPACQLSGGIVEVRRHHRVWSGVYFTRVQERSQVCCRSCGIKANARSMLFSAAFGWWGLPFGLILTPVQILANCIEMFKVRRYPQPSDELVDVARLELARDLHKGTPAVAPNW